MGFKHLLRRFLSHFVDCPLFGVENVLVAFPGDGRLSSPPSGIIIVCSGVRAQQWSVRLCSLVRGSKLVYCCFYLYGFQYAFLSVFFWHRSILSPGGSFEGMFRVCFVVWISICSSMLMYY